MRRPDLSDLVASFAGVRATVLGDLMLDVFVEGAVERIPPGAPIPVCRTGGCRTMLGGAGNVAHNVASLGGTASLIGLAGADGRGADLARLAAGNARLAPAATAPRRN